jgi:hypothetical protein
MPTKATKTPVEDEEQSAPDVEPSSPDESVESTKPSKATPQTADQPTDTPDEESETDQETEKPKKVPLRERLGELDDDDLEELLRHDRVSGKLGQLADKRARELKREEEEKKSKEDRVEAERREAERLRKLRRTDLAAYNAEMDAREAAEEFEKKEAERTRALAGSFITKLDGYVTDKFPAEVKHKFDNHTYANESFTDGVLHYVDDLINEERTQLRREVERELRPAIRKQILTELNGGESPEPANGGRGKPKAQQDYSTELEASEAFANGEIDLETLRGLYAAHRWRR